MTRHYDREVYNMVGEEPIVGLPLSSGCPVHTSAAAGVALAETAKPAVNQGRDFKFSWMFKGFEASKQTADEEQKEIAALVELGEVMNARPVEAAEDPDDETRNTSDIPSGYTYLGQFIAHEITFDKTEKFPTTAFDDVAVIELARTPTIDLDSLYGLGPTVQESKLFYQDEALLKVDNTLPLKQAYAATLPNDLPRGIKTDGGKREALIPEPRNDENLIVAQLHLALIKFHNNVVERFREKGLKGNELFKAAQESVIKHFQWIVLHDFLPRFVDENRLKDALKGPPKFFNDERKMYMPVEFSGAAFRFGHSMVRSFYEWNRFRNSRASKKVNVTDLFELTSFSGDLRGEPNLRSDWIIDWKHFYDFSGIIKLPNDLKFNRAKKIDTIFNLRLDAIEGYPHMSEEKFRPLTVRNLVRGHALRLPSGQRVADLIHAKRIEEKDFLIVPLPEPHPHPHAAVLEKHGFHKQTPLWYYILKEAELNGGGRLGEVGSFIIAETFAGILRHGSISILNEEWHPDLPAHEEGHFTMADLLARAGVIDSIGQRNCELRDQQYPCEW